MKKDSVDKRKSKPLNKETRGKYKAMVKACKNSKEHFKKLVTDREVLNDHYRAAVEYHEDILKNIEVPGKASMNPDPEVKKVMKELAQHVELAQVTVGDYKAEIICNKEIIKIARQQALVYWRNENRYRELLAAARTRKKKSL